jgi:hypothetical protein
MGYGCANPQWGEETDRGFETEKREKWRKGGHTPTTFSFYDEVFKAKICWQFLPVTHTARRWM